MSDLASWPALVLTAGLATRLRPLSEVRAKAAMPVAGVPIVGRILRWLAAAGVRRVVLNLHHRPETITRLVGDGSAWGLEVRYSWEGRILGSAGGPRRALPLLDADRFLVVNGDTLTDCDLGAVAARHRDRGAAVTMAVVPGDVERYGGVMVGGDGVVTGFARAARARPAGVAAEPPPGGRIAHFIGVQAVDARVFRDLPADEPLETVGWLYPRLIAATPGAVVAYESAAEFFDVGTAADYLATVTHVAAREGRALDRGDGCRLAPDARIAGTILWDRVTVEPGVELDGCVVADDVRVPAGTRLARTVVVAGPDGPRLAPF